MEIESLSPPVQNLGHNRGPPRDIVGPICIAIEALMVLANTLPIFVSIFLLLCCILQEISISAHVRDINWAMSLQVSGTGFIGKIPITLRMYCIDCMHSIYV